MYKNGKNNEKEKFFMMKLHSLDIVKTWGKSEKIPNLVTIYIVFVFDSRCGSASLCPWERHSMLFSTLGPNSLPVVVTQPDERHANRTASVLEWNDRHKA